MNKSVDVAIIGSGPGGALTGKILSAEGLETAIIDCGERHPKVKVPDFNLEELERKYWKRGMTFTQGSPKIVYAMGNCLGGGSEVNNAEYIALPESIFNKWKSDFKLIDFEYSHFENCYKKYQKLLQASFESETSFSALFRTGAEKLNFKLENVPRCHDLTTGENQTMSKTFIPEAEKNGCEIITKTKIEKISKQQDYWILEGLQDNQIFKMKCKTLFLCAGATQSAKLLLQNRLSKTPGKAFHCQPMLKVTAEFPDEVNYSGLGIPSLQVKEFAPNITLGCSISRRPYIASNILYHIKNHSEFQRKWKHYYRINLVLKSKKLLYAFV